MVCIKKSGTSGISALGTCFAINGFLMVLSFIHIEDIKTEYPRMIILVHFRETNAKLKGQYMSNTSFA